MADYTGSSHLSSWQRLGDLLLRSQSTDMVQTRRGRLLAAVLLSTECLTLIAMVLAFLFRTDNASSVLGVAAFIPGIMLIIAWTIIYFINRRGATTLAGILLSLVILLFVIALVARSGTMAPGALSIILPVIVAGFFAPPVSALVMAVLAGTAYFYLNFQANPAYMSDLLSGGAASQTLLVYVNLAFVAMLTWLFSRTTRQVLQESNALGLALYEQRTEMEARLQNQTRQLQATTSVARTVAGARDFDQLLEDIVRLVRETFGYYHVQVFLVDEERTYAVLRQSTGDAGKALLARGHRLPVGSLSVIGQVTASGHPVIARDTDKEFVHRRNELLPLTRSEMAMPLLVGDQVIGALDMQSVEPDAFDTEMLPTFRALADQLAIAIRNAQLFEMAEGNLRELRELSREVTQRSWTEFLLETREEERRQVYGPESKALEIHRSRVAERVLSSGSVIVSSGRDGRKAFLAAPVVVRNEVVGVLGVEPDEVREWSQEDMQMIQSIAERTALAIENARLYLQAQHVADRERLINTIAARLQRAPSLAILLESAAKELAQALGTEHVYAEISMEQPLAHNRRPVPDDSQGTEMAEEETGPANEMPASDKSEEVRA